MRKFTQLQTSIHTRDYNGISVVWGAVDKEATKDEKPGDPKVDPGRFSYLPIPGFILRSKI